MADFFCDDAQLTTSSGSVVVWADADLRLGLREAQFHFLLPKNILHGKRQSIQCYHHCHDCHYHRLGGIIQHCASIHLQRAFCGNVDIDQRSEHPLWQPSWLAAWVCYFGLYHRCHGSCSTSALRTLAFSSTLHCNLLSWPVIQIWKLQLSTARRLAIIGIFCFGALWVWKGIEIWISVADWKKNDCRIDYTYGHLHPSCWGPEGRIQAC